ncbi:hypothetical protein PGT21_031031 [Puccinia graminis f. sp. tritici]|uniref:Uncharacterized protein n=1 Tax=Puccinia graminis f. sp. tritici TaxID=56615 RepID=A0A5B0M0F6_PUCGR|nr:hypothetical protein PGT21_031031 [Puccinia graminis f. sp. tritici]
MSLLDTRRLLAFCGVFIASNAMKHFLWDSGHHLANPRIQEEASDPITLSLDSKKAGGSLQVEVQEDATYHNLKSAQSDHHDEHAMCSLNRELHDAGAELRLNSVNQSPVVGISNPASNLASALDLTCYHRSDRSPAISSFSPDGVCWGSRKRIRPEDVEERWPNVNVQPDDHPDFFQSPPIKLTRTYNEDSSGLKITVQAHDNHLHTTVDYLSNFGKCSEPEESSWITRIARPDPLAGPSRRVARFRYRAKDVSRDPDDCNEDRKLLGHSLADTPVAKKQEIHDDLVELGGTKNGSQKQLEEHRKLGNTDEEGPSTQHSSSLNMSNERSLVGINPLILESGMIQNHSPDIYKEIECKKNKGLSDHGELPMESLVFDESAFGVDKDYPEDQNKLEEILKIIRSSESGPAEAKRTLKLRFEEALDKFENVKHASLYLIQDDQHEAPGISTGWRYPFNGSRRASMQIKCIELWKYRLLWLKFWQKITQINLHSENLKYSTCKVIDKIFPLFLFYVDMIDTIIIDSSKLKSKTHSTTSSSDQLKREKANLFKVAIKRFEEFSKMRTTLKNDHNGLMKLKYGKSRKSQPHVQQLLWDFLEYWIRSSGRVELIELYLRGLKPKNQSFKGFFNMIFKLSIIQFNKRLRDSLSLE